MADGPRKCYKPDCRRKVKEGAAYCCTRHLASIARRGRTTWTAARMSAISWICPLAVTKTARWPSQKVTGLPGPLRRHSAPIDSALKTNSTRGAV